MWHSLRVKGYKNALMDYGLELKEENIVYSDFNNVDTAYERLKEFIKEKGMPKAIIAGNTNINLACIKVIHEEKKL